MQPSDLVMATFMILLAACGSTSSTAETAGEASPPGGETAAPAQASEAIGAPGTQQPVGEGFEWPAEVAELVLRERCSLLEEDAPLEWAECQDHVSASLLQLTTEGPPALMISDDIGHIVGGTANPHQLFLRDADRYRHVGELLDEPVLTADVHEGLPDLRVRHNGDCEEVFLYAYDGAAYREQLMQGCEEEAAPLASAPAPVVHGRCSVAYADDNGEAAQDYTYDAQTRWTSVASYSDGQPPMTVWTYRDDGTVAVEDGYGDEVSPVGTASVERAQNQLTIRYTPNSEETEAASFELHLDGEGRVVRVVHDGEETRCSYDGAGRLVQRASAEITETFRYRRGRLVSGRTTTAESPAGAGGDWRVARRTRSEVQLRETVSDEGGGTSVRTTTYTGPCMALSEPGCFVGMALLPPLWPAD